MKQTINEYDFIDAFRKMDRYNTFGHDALKALFEYLEEYEESTGEEMELDVIALCGDFTQYDSAIEVVQGIELDRCPECGGELCQNGGYEYYCPECEEDKKEDIEKYALEQLQEKTIVIEYDSGIIVQSF